MVNGLKGRDWKVPQTLHHGHWKPRILVALEENDLLENVKSIVYELSDEAAQAQWKKNEVLARKIMIYFVKDNLIPVISNLESAKEMFDTLKELYDILNSWQCMYDSRHVCAIECDQTELHATASLKGINRGL